MAKDDKERRPKKPSEIDRESVPERKPSYTPQSRANENEEDQDSEVEEAQREPGYTPQGRTDEEQKG
jgi:hypothetical protein